MQYAEKIYEYSDKDYNKSLNNENILSLLETKKYLDELYYNTGKSYYSDLKYDKLVNVIKLKKPDYVNKVGHVIRNSDNRVLLPYWVGSANKITPDEPKELSRWFSKNKDFNDKVPDLFVSEKLDGVSGTLSYKNGSLKLYTRGDGITGADISYLIKYIKSIPTISKEITVRGELIIRKDIFQQKYFESESKVKSKGKYRNARNMVSGLIGSKTMKAGHLDIDFVVYEIVKDSTMPTISSQFDYLTELGFLVPKNHIIKNLKGSEFDTNYFTSIHNDYKNKSIYEIDGIVVNSNIEYDRNSEGNPSYSFAFKVMNEDNVYETKVLDIEWSISTWGKIIPVAIIDPVILPGNTIRRVTVSNASLLKKKRIGPGAVIKVTLSKDVIPFIVSVSLKSKESELKWPDFEYKWDKNNVNIMVTNMNAETTCEMRIKLFSRFFHKMGIKFVGTETLKKLYSRGFDTLLKIISAKEEDLGMKSKSACRIVSNIKLGLTNVKESDILGACCSLGPGMGSKRISCLITNIPTLLIDKISKKELKTKILKVEGFSEIMADIICKNIDSSIEFINQIKKYATFIKNTRVSDSMIGCKYVFSGFRDKMIETDIINRGGKIVTSVSSKTTAVVTKNGNKTTKVDNAIKLGINVITLENLIHLLI
jgi:DNA ligase (NAD+)